MEKKLIKNLKEFKNFYEMSISTAERDGNTRAVKKIKQKIKELEELIDYYS